MSGAPMIGFEGEGEPARVTQQNDADFRVVLSDCPWRYGFSRSSSRRVENHYSTLSTREICAMVPPSAKDAVLFLWATAPKLLDALEVLKAWSFTYKTHAVWDKQRVGMGYWFRGRHELLLVGTKGKPTLPIPSNRVASIFTEKRGRHSAKPECVQAWIESAFDGPFLEMFARVARAGWTAVGNEIKTT